MKRKFSIFLCIVMLMSTVKAAFAQQQEQITDIQAESVMFADETAEVSLELESYKAIKDSITLSFNKEIDMDSLNLSFTEEEDPEIECETEISKIDGKTLSIKFKQELDMGKTYILSAPFIMDSEKKSIIADFSISIALEKLFSDDFEDYEDSNGLEDKYHYKKNDGSSYELSAFPEIVEIEDKNGNHRLKFSNVCQDATTGGNLTLMPKIQDERLFNNYILEYTVANGMNAPHYFLAYQGALAYPEASLTAAKKYAPSTQNNYVYIYDKYRHNIGVDKANNLQVATDDDTRMTYVMNGGKTDGTLSLYQNGSLILNNIPLEYYDDYGIFGFAKSSKDKAPLYIDDILAYRVNCNVSGTSGELKELSPSLLCNDFAEGEKVVCEIDKALQIPGVDVRYDWYTSKNENQYPQNDDEWVKVKEDSETNEFTIENDKKYIKCIVELQIQGIILKEYESSVLFRAVPPNINVKNGKPVADIVKKDDNTIQVTYEYMDANSDKEKGTTIEWFISKDLNADKKWELKKTSVINDGDEANDYDFDVTDMIDTFVKCVITVRSEYDETAQPAPDEATYTGTPVTLNYILPFKPVASNVKIIGTAEAGSVVKVSYSYYDENGDAENNNKTEIKWYRTGNGAKTLVGSGVTYVITSADAGYSIICEVTPANDTEPSKGETQSSVAISVIKKSGGNSSSSGGGSTRGGLSDSSKNISSDTVMNPYVKDSTFVSMPEKTSSFADTEKHWAKDYIERLYKKKIINGRDNDLFEPDSTITRAEWIALLIRGAGISTDSVKWQSCFTDVDENAWYASALQAAYDNKLAGGYEDGSFGPNENITREAMAKMLVETYEYCAKKKLDDSIELTFNDSSEIAYWAENNVKKAVAAGLINGDDKNCFNPKQNATRAEAAVMLDRMLELLNK